MSTVVRTTRTTTLLLLTGLALAAFVTALATRALTPSDRALELLIQLILPVAAAAIALVPFVRQRLLSLLDRIRTPSPRSRLLATVFIAVGACFYLYVIAILQGRQFIPKFHDEYQFLVQCQMLAHGRLWLPAHPLADFFETFYLIVRPVYAAQSFPGAPLMYLPTAWFGLESWVMPLVVSGAAVGVLYRVTTELLDGVAGVLAAVLLLSLSTFRMLSLMFLAHTPLLLLGLLALWAYLRWRTGHRLRFALLLGLFSGWAAIVRPVDAICIILPIGFAILWDLRKESLRRSIAVLASIILAASPFLALQVIFNLGVTGHALQTPFAYYNQREQPGLTFGFSSVDPSEPPASQLPQKRIFHDWSVAPAIRKHTPANLVPSLLTERLPVTLRTVTPFPVLLILLPLGIFAARRAIDVAILASVPLFLLLYSFYPLFLGTYTLTVAPGVIFAILLGLRQMERTWPGKPAISCLLILTIAGAVLMAQPLLNASVRDHALDTPTLLYIHQKFPHQIQPPAIVLFNFVPGNNPHEEPVYNIDSPTIDDCPIIRAHDLGPQKNAELFAYYARLQPNRTIYSFHRGTGQITRLGTAATLAGR